jgi:hypothetical protein
MRDAETRLALYRYAVDYAFSPPPVCSAHWTEQCWADYVSAYLLDVINVETLASSRHWFQRG